MSSRARSVRRLAGRPVHDWTRTMFTGRDSPWHAALRNVPEPNGNGVTDPGLFSPTFDLPMYEALRDYFPDLLLPGLEQIPPNTITLLQTNPKIIEAYMLGLNHEMGRELLWREYPVNAVATFFRQFWDPRGRSSASPNTAVPGSIAPIKSWLGNSMLGAHLAGSGPQGDLALLIRGDLLQRYPRTMIYAVQARPDGSLGEEEKYPSFRASWGSDVTVLGFELTREQARGGNTGAGWFFVLQQPPTEPGFGLDEPPSKAPPIGETPTTWADLNWAHVVMSEAEFKALGHVNVRRWPSTLSLPLHASADGTTAGSASWAKNGAHMARIVEQRQFRLAIHASVWISS
jgi:hypothetical protein